mmetsp:Transcript_34232/g.74794  ORF Transcript_34232/g.74794 Transcript_34232/m.74794 type:complete len:372 (-) Transcript_34232:107-1222(-)
MRSVQACLLAACGNPNAPVPGIVGSFDAFSASFRLESRGTGIDFLQSQGNIVARTTPVGLPEFALSAQMVVRRSNEHFSAVVDPSGLAHVAFLRDPALGHTRGGVAGCMLFQGVASNLSAMPRSIAGHMHVHTVDAVKFRFAAGDSGVSTYAAINDSRLLKAHLWTAESQTLVSFDSWVFMTPGERRLMPPNTLKALTRGGVADGALLASFRKCSAPGHLPRQPLCSGAVRVAALQVLSDVLAVLHHGLPEDCRAGFPAGYYVGTAMSTDNPPDAPPAWVQLLVLLGAVVTMVYVVLVCRAVSKGESSVCSGPQVDPLIVAQSGGEAPMEIECQPQEVLPGMEMRSAKVSVSSETSRDVERYLAQNHGDDL